MANLENFRGVLESQRQGHVLRFASQLSHDELGQLTKDLAHIDVGQLNEMFNEAITADSKAARAKKTPPQPIADLTKKAEIPERDAHRHRQTAFESMARGEVAVILLAGGQGTRLGSEEPKGMYDAGLVSHKSLFNLQVERIIKVQRNAEAATNTNDVTIPFYIMTSEFTDASTKKFFEDNAYFGLKKRDVFFFQQGSLPCLTTDGKIMMSSKFGIARAPDGNGGIYSALVRGGALADLRQRGVKYVHAIGVDNILVKVADPLFIGFCRASNADVGCKVVPKRGPDEPLGVFGMREDKHCVIEYSEMSNFDKNRRNEGGDLLFNSGNICSHFFTTAFLSEAATAFLKEGTVASTPSELSRSYHIARREIPCVDASGRLFTPKTPNGVKLELFIFDVFPLAKNLVYLEVDRESEFSPIKNGRDHHEDSAVSACIDLYRLHTKWCKDVGANIDDPEGTGSALEVSPLVSYEGEDLGVLVGGKTITLPRHLESTIFSSHRGQSQQQCGSCAGACSVM